jgi:hypothetical protein
MLKKLLFVLVTSLTLMGCWLQDAGSPVPREKDFDPADHYHDRDGGRAGGRR